MSLAHPVLRMVSYLVFILFLSQTVRYSVAVSQLAKRITQECNPPITKQLIHEQLYPNGAIQQDSIVFYFRKTGGYPHKQKCSWIVKSPPDRQLISFKMHEFSVAQPGDTLVVRDGPSSSYPILQNFTHRSQVKHWWTSSTTSLFVNFQSDEKNNGNGFVMYFRYIINIHACLTLSSIAKDDESPLMSPFYPNDYPNNQQCRWQVGSKQAEYISFKFKDIDLAPKDYIQVWTLASRKFIFDNATALSFIVDRWITLCYMFCNYWFFTDNQWTGRGYLTEIKYNTKPSACSTSPKIITSDKNEITSPLYPEYYPIDTSCTWPIKAAKNQVVGISFSDFELGPKDRIEIHDGENGTSVLLNSRISARLGRWWTSTGRSLTIRFKSTFYCIYRGFKLKIQFLKHPKACSSSASLLNASDGVLNPFSPYYPNNLRCTWMITAPQDQFIRFWFTKFDLTPGDYLEIRHGLNDSTKIKQTFTTKPNLDDRWASSGNNLWINFRSNEVDVSEGFALKWNFFEKQKACSNHSPEIVRSDAEQIQNSLDFQRYTNNEVCTWLVIAPQNKTLAFIVATVDLGRGDFFEILDGKNDSAPLIRNFTSATVADGTELQKASGRFLQIKFKSDHEDVGEGFRIVVAFQERAIDQVNDPQVPPVQPSPNILFTEKIITPSPITPIGNQGNSKTALGVGLGAGVLVVILMPFLFVFIKRRTHKNKSLGNLAIVTGDQWEINISQIQLLQEIGRGAFGQVWKGNVDRDVRNEAHPVTVAVKMLHEGATAQEKSDFLSEIEFMKTVGFHRNIITMVACCTKEGEAFVVVEFAEDGDLLKILKNTRREMFTKSESSASTKASEETSNDNDNKKSMEIILEKFVSFSWQIAMGMEYLSSKGIVHRDLATRNILVAEGHVAKVADFGLSRNVTYAEHVYKAQGRRRLPLRWMAPEALDEQIFTSKTDVWSYGVVLWEIFSMGKLPYRTLYNEQLLRWLKMGRRMEKPELCPDEIYSLMESCWNEHAYNRPSFSDVIKNIEKIMTRDKPYVELIEMTEGNDGYMVPVDNISDIESDISDAV